MTKYKILRSTGDTGYVDEETSNNFSKTIEKYLNDGWDLVGGIAMGVSCGNEHFLYQAITKTH